MKVASTVRRGDKGSYGSACPTLRCSGASAVRMCCCKRASRPSTEHWALCSSDGTPTWKSRNYLMRPNPQHLHALLGWGRREQVNLREIGTHPPGITGQEGQLRHQSMCPNEKVRERQRPRAAPLPIRHKGFARKKTGFP